MGCFCLVFIIMLISKVYIIAKDHNFDSISPYCQYDGMAV